MLMQNQEIIDYIKKAKEAGQSDGQIITELINNSHSKDDIYAAYQFLVKKEGYKIMPKWYIWLMPMHKLYYLSAVRGIIYGSGPFNPLTKRPVPVKSFSGILMIIFLLIIIGFVIFIQVRRTISKPNELQQIINSIKN